MYDVIIIGGGAAGLTAAIYTTRRKLKTLVLSVDIGGQTNLTQHIENYPGYTELSGPKLMQVFEEQAKNFGAEIIFGKVTKIEKTDKIFEVRLANDEKYEGRTVIVTSGKVPRSLGISGEEKFMGRGVTTCAICDGPLYKNKKIAIIGGGNSALDAAEYMSKIASKVYLVHRRNEFRGEAVLVDRVKAAKNVELVLNSVPLAVNGDKFVSGLTIENAETKEKKDLDVSGVFVEIGYIADTSAVKDLVKLNSKGEILVDEYCETGTDGLFAAGDITNVPYKQTVISAGQGAVAGLQAYTYLQKLEGKTAVKADWGV